MQSAVFHRCIHTPVVNSYLKYVTVQRNELHIPDHQSSYSFTVLTLNSIQVYVRSTLIQSSDFTVSSVNEASFDVNVIEEMTPYLTVVCFHVTGDGFLLTASTTVQVTGSVFKNKVTHRCKLGNYWYSIKHCVHHRALRF